MSHCDAVFQILLRAGVLVKNHRVQPKVQLICRGVLRIQSVVSIYLIAFKRWFHGLTVLLDHPVFNGVSHIVTIVLTMFVRVCFNT